MKRKFFSAVFSAAILTMASTGVTVFAEESGIPESASSIAEAVPTESVPESEISAADDSSEADINSILGYMGQFADEGNVTITKNENESGDNSKPDYYGDDFYDTSGNATLIKSEQIIYNSEEMQFIAVTTKDGHVFYVLINYSAENGEDNVYFLNKVDDYDLYALLYADKEDEDGNPTITPEQAVQSAEAANGRISNKTESTEKTERETTSSSLEEKSESAVPKKSAPTNKSMIYLVIGVIALGAIGFIGFKFLKKPKKKTVAETDEEDEINFYDNDEINEDEE